MLVQRLHASIEQPCSMQPLSAQSGSAVPQPQSQPSLLPKRRGSQVQLLSAFEQVTGRPLLSWQMLHSVLLHLGVVQ